MEVENDSEECLENEIAVSIEGGLPVTSAVESLVLELEKDANLLLTQVERIPGLPPLHPLSSGC